MAVAPRPTAAQPGWLAAARDRTGPDAAETEDEDPPPGKA
jgi:hypothetical protein